MVGKNSVKWILRPTIAIVMMMACYPTAQHYPGILLLILKVNPNAKRRAILGRIPANP